MRQTTIKNRIKKAQPPHPSPVPQGGEGTGQADKKVHPGQSLLLRIGRARSGYWELKSYEHQSTTINSAYNASRVHPDHRDRVAGSACFHRHGVLHVCSAGASGGGVLQREREVVI